MWVEVIFQIWAHLDRFRRIQKSWAGEPLGDSSLERQTTNGNPETELRGPGPGGAKGGQQFGLLLRVWVGDTGKAFELRRLG